MTVIVPVSVGDIFKSVYLFCFSIISDQCQQRSGCSDWTFTENAPTQTYDCSLLSSCHLQQNLTSYPTMTTSGPDSCLPETFKRRKCLPGTTLFSNEFLDWKLETHKWGNFQYQMYSLFQGWLFPMKLVFTSSQTAKQTTTDTKNSPIKMCQVSLHTPCLKWKIFCIL